MKVHMAVAVALALALALLTETATATYTTPDGFRYDHKEELMANYHLYWTVDLRPSERRLDAAIVALTDAWVGFGIGEQTSGSMPGSDVVTAVSRNGVISLTDGYTVAFDTPITDVCQDVELRFGLKNNGLTVVHFSRPLDVEEVNNDDRPIPPGNVAVVFAYGKDGDEEDVAYHGSNRGFSRVVFYTEEEEAAARGDNGQSGDDDDVAVDPPPSENIEVMSMAFDNNPIPSDVTTYMCQVFPAPTEPVHLVSFDTIISGSPKEMVHHWIMYECDDPEFDYDPFQCDGVGGRSCTGMIAAWAPGAGKIEYPREAGFRAGLRSGGPTHLLFEIHFDNPDRLEGIVDSTGVEVGFVREFREHDVGVMVLGDPGLQFPPIPPGFELAHRESECPSACTSLWPHPIRVFADQQHMHSIGRSAVTSYHPLMHGERLTHPDAFNAVQFYQFEMQQMTPVDWVVYPGDALNTHCFYDSTTRTEETPFAEASDDEMCLELLYYYPKLPDRVRYCGYANDDATVCGADRSDLLDVPNPVVPDPLELFSNQVFGTGCNVTLSMSSTPEPDLDLPGFVDDGLSDDASASTMPSLFSLLFLVVLAIAGVV